MAKKREQGLTLVELLVAMVAASILLGAVVRLILASQKMWLGAADSGGQYQKTISSFESVGASVRSCKGLVKEASDQRQLVLLTKNGTCRYWFADDKLWRQEAEGSGEIILDNISEGNFAYWSNKRGEQSTPPQSGAYSVLINVSWSGGSLKTGFFIREWS